MSSGDRVGMKKRFANEDETVCLVENAEEKVEEATTARIDLELLKEGIEFAEKVGKNTQDVHIVDTGGDAKHIYITVIDETEEGIFICGKTGLQQPDFESESSRNSDKGDSQ